MKDRPITYIKRDIVQRTMEKVNLDKSEVRPIVDTVFKVISDIIISTEGEFRIEIRDFGVLLIKNTAAKPKARNPRKPDQVIYIPARRKTYFRPGRKIFKAMRKPLSDNE